MKKYLIDTFQFNDEANKKLLAKIRLLPDQAECSKLFSHLINCQYKWLMRIKEDGKAQQMSWWDPLYSLDQMEEKWEDSVRGWITYIGSVSEEALNEEITFKGVDGDRYAVTPLDIALQLNYHSIHHRAQMQMIIRKQNVEPDAVDYIRGRSRKLS